MANNQGTRAEATNPSQPVETNPAENGELVENQLEEISGGLQLDEVSLNFTRTERGVPTDQYSHTGTDKMGWDRRQK